MKRSMIKKSDLWENYSFVLHEDGDDSNDFATVKVKDLLNGVIFTENEDGNAD